MRLAFRKVEFGNFGIQGSKQFVYPSFVRLGKEANYLIHKATEIDGSQEKLSTLSSPKRYLWDGKNSKEEWKFMVLEGESYNHILNIPGLSEHLQSNGQLANNGTGGQSYHYSRRSLMVPVGVLRKIAYDIVILKTETPKDFNEITLIRTMALINPNDDKLVNIQKLCDYYACDINVLEKDFGQKGFTVDDVVSNECTVATTVADVVSNNILEYWTSFINKQVKGLEKYLPHSDEVAFMLQVLCKRLGVRKIISNKIDIYSRVFPDNDLPNAIADFSSLTLNNFVSSIGREYMAGYEIQAFDANKEAIEAATIGLTSLTDIYTSTGGIKINTIITGIILFMMLLFPYILQKRNTRANGLYFLLPTNNKYIKSKPIIEKNTSYEIPSSENRSSTNINDDDIFGGTF